MHGRYYTPSSLLSAGQISAAVSIICRAFCFSRPWSLSASLFSGESPHHQTGPLLSEPCQSQPGCCLSSLFSHNPLGPCIIGAAVDNSSGGEGIKERERTAE
ncbi:hypothetical protein AOXY_G18788 [Acipenser oxyrinchus oxyrinchus]|uniref:Uncharacterized protein n=1 Tax=Acipenser oxyrinchus oxyrinchus TaxID=40147 RepID=A0AAD8D355_ACIOX|nr:hypothetical protein AOXY_G18788 [Acipenser oxyrinchus oxyrinchus]